MSWLLSRLYDYGKSWFPSGSETVAQEATHLTQVGDMEDQSETEESKSSVLIGVEEEPKPSKDGVVGQEALDELQPETVKTAQDRDPATVPLPPPTPGEKSLLASTPEMRSPAAELDEIAPIIPADAGEDQNPAEPFQDPTPKFWLADDEIESAPALSRPSKLDSKAPSKVGKSDSQSVITGPAGDSVIGTDGDVGERPHLAQPDLILADDPNSPQLLSIPRRKAKSDGYIREKLGIADLEGVIVPETARSCPDIVKGHQLPQPDHFIPVENARLQSALDSTYPVNAAAPAHPVLAIGASSNNADIDTNSEVHTQIYPIQRSRPTVEILQKWAVPVAFVAGLIGSVTIGRAVIWLVKKWKSRAQEDELTDEEDSDPEDFVKVKKVRNKKHHRRHVRDWTIYED